MIKCWNVGMKIDIPYKRWKKAVRRRVSRRKYYPEPIEKEDRNILGKSVRVLKKEFPLSRVIIKQKGFSEVSKNIIGSYGLITGASSYAVLREKRRKIISRLISMLVLSEKA